MRRSPFTRLYWLAGIWLLALCLLSPLAFYTGVRARFQSPSELIDQNGAGVQVLERDGRHGGRQLLAEPRRQLPGADAGGVREPGVLEERRALPRSGRQLHHPAVGEEPLYPG